MTDPHQRSSWCLACNGGGLDAVTRLDCGNCEGSGIEPDNKPSLEARLAALVAEHAKALNRIERLERAVVALANFVTRGPPINVPEWDDVIISVYEIRRDVAANDRARGAK